MKDAVSTGPKWTQDESINYECARDCITELIGIYSGAIASEEAKASPDQGKISDMLAVRSSLARERMALRVKDHERIAEVQSTYNAKIRAYRLASQCQDV